MRASDRYVAAEFFMKTRRYLFAAGVLLAAVCTLCAQTKDSRKKLVMLIAEPEYDTITSLPAFAAQFLAKDFRIVVASGSTAAGENSFDKIDEVADADVLLVSVRRRTPPKAQMDLIRKHIATGKPVVGIRTACHAFALAGKQPLPAGCADWPEWDAQVIGGHYTGHHGHGPTTTMTAAKADDPILRGVALPFTSLAWFYKVSPLRDGATALLTGAIPNQPTEPVAWTFRRADGGRTFFTSLGTKEDFQNASFTRLLQNGIRWAAESPARK
jgi:type 1 glutamine amidotransferase